MITSFSVVRRNGIIWGETKIIPRIDKAFLIKSFIAE
jgi:hypothetical protein